MEERTPGHWENKQEDVDAGRSRQSKPATQDMRHEERWKRELKPLGLIFW